MRTDEEIITRIKERRSEDFFGFELSDLIRYLPAEEANRFLVEPVTNWTPLPRDQASILEEMENYMPFAWEKANGMRGLSAGRSMSHFMAWTWMVGDDFGDLLQYYHYGKDNLVRICKHYGWDHTQWDDGVRSNG
jgi:hypothetical protein